MEKFPIIRRSWGGSLLSDHLPPALPQPLVSLPGTCQGRPAQVQLDRAALGCGTLVLGATGTGKTVATRKLAEQLRRNLAVPHSMVVLEVKEDYSPTLFAPGDLILGQGAAYRDKSIRWNLFQDLTFDGWDRADLELNTMEFCRQLFSDKKNQSQQFFPDAAQLLLQQVLLAYLEEGRTSLLARKKLTNRGLREFFRQFGTQDYASFLRRCPDPGVVQMLLGSGADSNQALGVLGELVITLLFTFTDVFGEEGDFSIRQFVREKRGQCLFLRFDPAYQESQRRLYGAFLSLMLKEVLSHGNGGGDLVFLCDELPALGRLPLLSSAVNLGRAKGFFFVGGLQSVAQLNALYGEQDAAALLAGLRTKLLFAPNDPVSRAFMQDHFGKTRVEELVLSVGGVSCKIFEAPLVEDRHIQALGLGDCICSVAGGPPFQFHVFP